MVSGIIKQISHYAYICNFLHSTEPWSPITNKTWSIHVSFIFYYLCTFPASLAWIIGAYHICIGIFLYHLTILHLKKPIQKQLVLLTPGIHRVCCTGLFQCLVINAWHYVNFPLILASDIWILPTWNKRPKLLSFQ
jgi:hypothetical protein